MTMNNVDDKLRDIVHVLLANLVGADNRIHEVYASLSHESLPLSMPYERAMLRALRDIPSMGGKPTETNVKTLLRVRYSMADDELFASIMSKRTVYAQVEWTSRIIYEVTNEQRRQVLWNNALGIVMSNKGTPEERQQEALSIVLAELGDTMGDASLSLSGSGVADYYRAHLLKAYDNAKRGMAPGISTVFYGLRPHTTDEGVQMPGLMPWLRWGESSLLTSFSGFGKTIFGMNLAIRNAKENVDVVYITNETDIATLLKRWECMETLIPFDTLDDPMSTKWDEPENNITARRMKFLEHLKKHDNIHFLWAAGWNPYMIANAIALYRIKATANGRGLFILLDYFNNVNVSKMNGNNESQRYGDAMRYLRDAVKQQNTVMQNEGGAGLHFMTAAQQTIGDSTAGNQTYVFGAGKIMVQLSQVHIELEREKEAPETLKVDGKTDFFGNPRYWHFKGGLKREAQITIHKQNNGREHVSAPIFIEAPFFTIHDRIERKPISSILDKPVPTKRPHRPTIEDLEADIDS